MNEQIHNASNSENQGPIVFILSGGAGTSGEQLVHTALAQFPEKPVRVVTLGNIRQEEQLEKALEQVQQAGGVLVHTMVDPELRRMLVERAQEQELDAIDAMGPLLDRLTGLLGQEPAGLPGRYRLLHKDYFNRVAAIEYTMAHDDGKDLRDLDQADIVLTGVSRVGKTPLSLYLSILGWKVANIPLVPGLPLPGEMFQLENRRVFGLTIQAGQLILLRQQRQSRIGAPGPSDYVKPEKVHEEIQAAEKVFRKAGFQIIDITDKPIESSADEIIRRVTK